MEKTMRITKAMRYADLKAMLNGEAVTYGTTLADALAFIDKEVSLLAKKNSGEKKPTKAQEENEGYKALILGYLATCESATCTDILKNVSALSDFSNQKISALMRQLRLANKVEAKEVKGKTLFSLIREVEG